jgi:hypothetical protein
MGLLVASPTPIANFVTREGRTPYHRINITREPKQQRGGRGMALCRSTVQCCAPT